MILIEHTEVLGIDHAMRGMRNPMNSWDRSDSHNQNIGTNDLALAKRLSTGGPVHAKYRRFITVYHDITAPLYWWKEFDTYKVGTVANSCSTMHKIHENKFTLDDFSSEHLFGDTAEISINEENLGLVTNIFNFIGVGNDQDVIIPMSSSNVLNLIVNVLNMYRDEFIKTQDKKYWWQMIQLLPSSYNQKRTIMLNYEVLAGIYPMRRNHKLDEWKEYCAWIKTLPYSEIITLCESQES